MNPWWSYFWPIIGIGLACGMVAGAIGFRRAGPAQCGGGGRRLAALAGAVLWHGPFEGANRFTEQVERMCAPDARQLRDDAGDRAAAPRAPHPAADPCPVRPTIFSAASWCASWAACPGSAAAAGPTAGGGLPLIAEGAIAALAAFLSACCSPIWSSFGVVTTQNGNGDCMQFIRKIGRSSSSSRGAGARVHRCFGRAQRVRLTDSAPIRPHMVDGRPSAKAAASPAKRRPRPATSPAR